MLRGVMMWSVRFFFSGLPGSVIAFTPSFNAGQTYSIHSCCFAFTFFQRILNYGLSFSSFLWYNVTHEKFSWYVNVLWQIHYTISWFRTSLIFFLLVHIILTHTFEETFYTPDWPQTPFGRMFAFFWHLCYNYIVTISNSGDRKEVFWMHFLLSLAVAVMGNVISYYIVKWLDSNRKNGNQPGTTSTWKL